MQIDNEFAKIGIHGVTNIGESQFIGLIDNICALKTKLPLDMVKEKSLKAFLVMIEKMPTKLKKASNHNSASVIEIMASPLVKFLQVNFFCLK